MKVGPPWSAPEVPATLAPTQAGLSPAGIRPLPRPGARLTREVFRRVRRGSGETPAWAAREPEELARELQVDLRLGLTPPEAARRLELFGPNEIGKARRISPLRILASQFTNFMVVVLIAAAVVSFFLGEAADMMAILAIVALNAVLGFIQEFRAERAMERLRELAAPTARVVRGGTGGEAVVPARELVPGDVVLVEAGDRIPADLRILEAHALRTQEAALTGESAPVAKCAAVPDGEPSSLADLKDALFSGTEVAGGRGRGLVVATGMETEFGKIAGLIQGAGADSTTPLQRRMEELGRYLVLACFAISALVVWAGVMRGEPLLQMLLAGVSLAVAAIPEGLPAVVTILLALGVQRMIRRQVIVRKLPAVETLGCATVICTDKTGTLTQNEMTVRRLWTPSGSYVVTGQGFGLRGVIRPLGAAHGAAPSVEAGTAAGRKAGTAAHGKAGAAAGAAGRLLGSDPALRLLLMGGVLCSNARLDSGRRPEPGGTRGAVGAGGGGSGGGAGGAAGVGGRVVVYGDPTEGALLVAGAKARLTKTNLEKRFPRVDELPFSSERRRMTTVHSWEGGAKGVNDRRLAVFCKGAPDTVLDLCSRYQGPSGPVPLTPEHRAKVLAVNDRMASSGLRVLALAYRGLPAGGAPGEGEAGLVERDLVLAGLAGMSDPPRPEVYRAVEVCRQAGVKVSMITGDHPSTALAVARELRLLDPALPDDRQVLVGRDLDHLSDRALARRADEVRVYARVSPGHKLKIVRGLRARGEVVAMTGDGVNDAPAVREADIGVAMGLTGTAVTKEASDMVLTDDNFASVVAALEEGRTIYDNIRRSIRYLLSCNTGEVLTMLLGALFRLPLPLLPLQILWVNLVTDGLPAMALGLQAPEADVAVRPPRPPREGIFARGLGRKILLRGTIIGLSTIGIYALALRVTGWDLPLARTVAFATLCLSQLVHAFDCRSEKRALVEVPLSSNWYLVGGTLLSMAMLLAAIYVPGMRPFFKTAPLGLAEWTWVVVASAWGQVAVGARRVVLAARARRKAPTGR